MSLRIALVGCGQIADAHLAEIKKIENTTLVGLCDLYEYQLREFAHRFQVEKYYLDFDEMLREAKPDIVHITTPPFAHFEFAMHAIEKGIHVYIEKPLTPTATETEKLIEAAEKHNVKLCAGHNWLFDPRYLDLREMINSDSFGRILHVDAYYGYSLQSPFGKLISANPEHWVNKLPGKLFQNIISHPLSVIVPFIGDTADVHVFAAAWGKDAALLDELRVLIGDAHCTANLTFTCNISPMIQYVKYYGERRSAGVDYINRIVLQEIRSSLPGAFGRNASVFKMSKFLFSQAFRNTRAFLNGSEPFFISLNNIFRAFYRSITENAAVPVPYEEILRSGRLMDAIFKQLPAQ